ncbi:MAG: hypothetical protein JO061_11540 [Acidobacteriaceae bacterium]|nr:hypothetical protein [Acidobacteriaceae bacterium]
MLKTGSDTARIRLDPGRIIVEIDPRLDGNFTERLGRCIEARIFDEALRSRSRKAFAATCSMR